MKESFFPNSILQIIILWIVSIVLASPYAFIVKVNSWSGSDLRGTLFYVLVCAIYIGICWLVNYRKKRKMEWNFHPVNIRQISLPLTILLLFSVGINKPANSIINQIIHHHPTLSNPVDRPFHSVSAMLIAPIVEETIYRGIVLKGLLTRYTPQKAIVISALLFGIIHGLPLQIWGATIVGFILGWVYYHTKSIGTTILLHSLLNTAVLLNQYIFFHYVKADSVTSTDLMLLILSIPLVFIVVKRWISKSGLLIG